MPTQIACQLYTLREFTKTPKDIAGTFSKVKKTGYDAVQLSALGPVDTKELARMLDGEGLVCAATHAPYDQMRDRPQECIDYHHALKCKHTAIGGLPKEYRNAEGYPRFAREASAVAKKLKETGQLTWSYHNHSFELEKFGGRTALEILVSESDAKYFNMEIDVYWVTHGGGDPSAWVRRCKGRIPLVHFKDMVIRNGEKGTEQLYGEVGEGNLNWPEILKACKEAGVEWYIAEQDTCQRDPFESVAISLNNMKAMGLK